MSDDEKEFGICEYCKDKHGMCDRPHLVGGRRFSIKLDDTFEVDVSHNDKYFFVIKHDFCFFCFNL